SPTCDASLPGVLRGTSGRRGLGVPDLWLHPPHARSGESGDRLHAPWPGPPRRVRVWPENLGLTSGIMPTDLANLTIANFPLLVVGMFAFGAFLAAAAALKVRSEQARLQAA